MRLSTRLLLGLGLAFTVTACGDKDSEDDTGDVDTDADTDTDTDDDTDDDTDEDTDPPEEVLVEGDAITPTLAHDDADAFIVNATTVSTSSGWADAGETMSGGTSWYQVETAADGTETTLCDSTIELSGTAYSGDCEDCDFAYEVTSTESDDGGISDCSLPVITTWTESSIYKNPLMMFWSAKTETDEYYGTEYNFTNLLRTGVSIDYSDYGYGYYPGPYFGTVAYDGAETGAVTPSTDEGGAVNYITWTFEDTYEDTSRAYFEYCDYIDYWDAYEKWTNVGGTDDIDCEGELVDVWEVDLAAGDWFLVSVDTVAADTAFDPWIFINGPDSCFTASADDSFDCTYEPTNYQCPSIAYEAADSGTYEVVVASFGSCTGESAAYELNTAYGEWVLEE